MSLIRRAYTYKEYCEDNQLQYLNTRTDYDLMSEQGTMEETHVKHFYQIEITTNLKCSDMWSSKQQNSAHIQD